MTESSKKAKDRKMVNTLAAEILLQAKGKGLCSLCGGEKDIRLLVCEKCSAALVEGIKDLTISRMI